MSDVDHPKHYNDLGAVCSKCGHPIECIDVVEKMSFSIGNAVKYLWRAGKKGSAIEDLEKAIWYIQRHIINLRDERAVVSCVKCGIARDTEPSVRERSNRLVYCNDCWSKLPE